jgi:hypothetical protein
MLAEPTVTVRCEVSKVRDKDLALLAERAGHEGYVHAFCGVLRHRCARRDCLVVGMRMDQKEAPITVDPSRRHPAKAMPGVAGAEDRG